MGSRGAEACLPQRRASKKEIDCEVEERGEWGEEKSFSHQLIHVPTVSHAAQPSAWQRGGGGLVQRGTERESESICDSDDIDISSYFLRNS